MIRRKILMSALSILFLLSLQVGCVRSSPESNVQPPTENVQTESIQTSPLYVPTLTELPADATLLSSIYDFSEYEEVLFPLNAALTCETLLTAKAIAPDPQVFFTGILPEDAEQRGELYVKIVVDEENTTSEYIQVFCITTDFNWVLQDVKFNEIYELSGVAEYVFLVPSKSTYTQIRFDTSDNSQITIKEISFYEVEK